MNKLKIKLLRMIISFFNEHEIKEEITNIYKKDVELYNRIVHVKKGKIKYQLLVIKPGNDTESVYHLRRHDESDLILENPTKVDLVRRRLIFENNK